MTTPHLDFSQKEADDIYDELRELHVGVGCRSSFIWSKTAEW